MEAFVTECEPPETVVKIVALLATGKAGLLGRSRLQRKVFFAVVILYVNCYSVNLATNVQNVFTAAKLVAVLIVIIGGAYKMAEGEFSFHIEK